MVSLRFLLDTNVISEAMRPVANPRVDRKMRRYEGRIAIASIVWQELLFGWGRLPASRRKSDIEDYLFQVVRPEMPILPYDQTAAEWHAKERVRLTAIGRPPSFLDGQIAATAKAHDLVLVTFNRAHFEAFSGLEIEDWRS
jgi:tRNA(fMet)-specific endonuclease VapC